MRHGQQPSNRLTILKSQLQLFYTYENGYIYSNLANIGNVWSCLQTSVVNAAEDLTAFQLEECRIIYSAEDCQDNKRSLFSVYEVKREYAPWSMATYQRFYTGHIIASVIHL